MDAACSQRQWDLHWLTVGRRDGHRYVECNMHTGAVVWPVFNALQAFWPGIQVCSVSHPTSTAAFAKRTVQQKYAGWEADEW